MESFFRKVRPTSHCSIWDSGWETGCTDVARTFAGKPFKLREHVDRLYRSMAYTRLDIQETPDEFEKICAEVLERNRPLLGPKEDYALWINVTRGLGILGRDDNPRPGPTVAAYCINLNLKPFSRGLYRRHPTGDAVDSP